MPDKVVKINLDFEVIESKSPKILIVGDFSEWSQLYQKPSILKITLPGSNKPSSHNFIKKSLNSYNSVTLGLTNVQPCKENYADLPDGIYFLELLASPSTYKFSRYYLKLDRTRLKLDEIYIKSGFEYDPKDKKFREDMADIEFLLRVAEARTREGDIKNAKRDFDEAIKIMNSYSECKNCY